MGRNLDSKCKQCRRIGEKLMLKGERCYSPKCAMVKRNYPPGFHGQGVKRRKSDYAIQLNEKQKAKKQYNILEKQFRLTFEKAKKQSGNIGENLLRLLEMRFDNVVYRLGFSPSRNHARQIINHGHITINGKKVDIPSYIIKQGDIIKIKKTSVKNKLFKGIEEKVKKTEVPGWIHFDIKELNGKILHQPSIKDIHTNINTQMIVEYYSR